MTLDSFLSSPINPKDPSQFYTSGCVLFVLGLTFWIVLDWITSKYIFNRLAAHLFPEHAIKKGQDKKDETPGTLREKFTVAAWKGLSYGLLFSFEIYIICSQDWIGDPYNYVQPLTSIRYDTAILYHLSIASYFHHCYRLIVEPRLKDFYQMLGHHFVTLVLLLGSYYAIQTINTGIVILFLHDAADPFMEVAKMFFYTNNMRPANIFFGLFAGVFIVSRLFLYPPLCLYTLWIHPRYLDLWELRILFWFLVVILALDIYWSFLIVSMVSSSIVKGDVQGDIREKNASLKRE